MYTPLPLVRGEDTLAGWKGGGGSIFWKTPDTDLYSTYVSTLGSRQKIVFLGRLLNYQHMPLCVYQLEARGIVESQQDTNITSPVPSILFVFNCTVFNYCKRKNKVRTEDS